MAFEVRAESIKEEFFKYFIYKIQEGCESITYKLVQGEKNGDGRVIWVLVVREKMSGKEKHRCKTCLFEFSRRHDWSKHNSKCSILLKRKETKFKNPMDDHGYPVPSSGIFCGIHGKFANSKSVATKTEKKHEISNKTCEIGLKEHKTHLDLRKHLYVRHEKTDSGFMCERCGKTFPKYHLFWKHKLIHSNFKPHECSLCKKNFRSKKQLRSHIASHESSEITKEEKYVCEICKKSLLKEEYFKAHMRTHTGDLEFECHKCKKKFSSSIGLSIHKAHKRN